MPEMEWIEAHLLTILDESGIGLWRIDRQTRRLTISGRRCIYDVFGITEDFWHIDSRDFLSLHCHPDDSLAIRHGLENIVPGEHQPKISFRVWNEVLRTWVWVSISCTTTFEENELIYLSGVFENITLFKRHEAAQRKADLAEERVQIMFNATPLCCNLWDENFNNIDCNDEAVRLFNLKDKNAYLDNFYKLSPVIQPGGESSRNLAQRYIEQAFQTGHARFEWMHQKFDGEPIPSEITLVRVSWGGTHYVAGYTRDMREQKAMLSEMDAAYEALRIARDMALRNTEAKSEFLATMSHEIRTPMNAIIGMSHLLSKTELTEKQLDYVSKTSSAAELLLRIINDILDFSKIEAGKLDMESVPFSMADLFGELQDFFRATLRDKQLSLTFEGVELLPESVVGDPVRLKQVFLNLMSNAIKFTPAGAITVSIEDVTRDEDAFQIKCSVRDTGIGMTMEQTQRIFSAFSQADSSTTRKYGGTGLGLAISRQLVKLMGGNIWCESVVDSGTTFYFTMKLTKDLQPEKRALRHENLLTDRQPTPARLRCKILLAEDNEINQMIAVELLEGVGYQVVVANNGEEAVNLLLADKGIDVVLMDIQMPVLDGLEATKRIREYPQFANIPIIAMTARAMAGDKERSLEAGMSDYITKPIVTEELYAVLKRWLT